MNYVYKINRLKIFIVSNVYIDLQRKVIVREIFKWKKLSENLKPHYAPLSINDMIKIEN